MGDHREPKPQPKQPQHDVQPSRQPRPPAPASPAPVDRVTPLPARFDVGEQVFGSSHVFELAAPWNLGPGEAQIAVELAGNDAFTVESSPSVLHVGDAHMTSQELSDQLQSPIKLRFAPVAEGEYPQRIFGADLAIQLRWADGTVERRTVKVAGRGRTLEDRPEPARAPQENPALSTPMKPPPGAEGPYKEADRTRLDREFETAKNNAGAVARAQHDVIDNVQGEAGTYVPPPVKHSFWWDLAEGAIMLGTGMVAGAVGQWLANELITVAAGSTNKTLINGVSSAVKDGIKAGAKAALNGLSNDSTYDVSSNQRIAFFAMQKDALNTLVTNNQQVIIDRHAELTPLLGSEPDVAVRAMAAIANALKGQKPDATDFQKSSTATAWIGFRSRIALGTEEMPTRDHERVTNLAHARPAHPGPNVGPIKGLLDLDVDIEHGAPYVEAARVNGVARSLANELIGKPLTDFPLSVRIVIGNDEPEPTIITRDEAGRIRVSGNLSRLSRFSADGDVYNESQAELVARRLADEILSRPLAPKSGGVMTDDNGKGD